MTSEDPTNGLVRHRHAVHVFECYVLRIAVNGADGKPVVRHNRLNPLGDGAEYEPILALGLREPMRLPPEVLQFVSSMHPAHTPQGYRLVQVDPRHTVHRAERGVPVIELFDAEAWGEARIEPVYPISASICLADVALPRLRFLCRPGEMAFTGTESIADT